MVVLTDLQRDALTEAFNLGMGAAAAALSEMVAEEVVLSAPELIFLKKSEAAEYMNRQSLNEFSGVAQRFSGPFDGRAMLLFAGDKSLELVRFLLQDAVPLDKLTEFEEEALNEVGNIILNAGVSSLGDMFEQEIHSGLPVYMNGQLNELLELKDKTRRADTVMLLRIDFRLEKYAVEGYVVFLLSVESVKEIAEHINRFLEKIPT